MRCIELGNFICYEFGEESARDITAASKEHLYFRFILLPEGDNFNLQGFDTLFSNGN